MSFWFLFKEKFEMLNHYEKPNIKLLILDEDDVITTSGLYNGGDLDDDSGSGGEHSDFDDFFG